MTPTPASNIGRPTRRAFLQQTSRAVAAGTIAGGALASNLLVSRTAHAAGEDTIRIGLVGCGGRGNGAAMDALGADQNIKLVALADAFEDQVKSCRDRLRRTGGGKVDLADDRCYWGFDAAQKLIDNKDIDVVLLATPPHFRPAQYHAAIEAGKHVFVEKPVAVDGPGVRSVMKTNELAKEKGLSVVSGLCWRYHNGVQETMKRIQDGAIGDIVAIQENYNTGPLWHRGRKAEWSEMEYQMRNWLYFTWLSGDHNVEQHVHSLDKASWLMGDAPPVRAMGLGGRQVRIDEKWGNIFDHHAVCYEYQNGVRVFAYTRQQPGTSNDVEDYVLGTKGRARVLKHEIEGEKPWRFAGRGNNMYQAEHDALFAGIRAGKPLHNGDYMATSTMLAILGRMATYTGQTITWDQAINSKEDLSPKKYEWGDIEVPTVPMPGATKFV